MGLLQITQIERRLNDTVASFVDVSDLGAHGSEQVEVTRRSRALAAFLIMKLAHVDSEVAAQVV